MSSELTAASEAATTTAAVKSKNLLVAWPARVFGALSAAVGAVAGITPHVLHHIGPIAGAAVLTGFGGSVLFAIIGFVLTVPMLLKLRRRFGSWLAPSIALVLFASMFTISTLWVGPAIRGDSDGGDSTPQEQHHSSSSRPDSPGVDSLIVMRGVAGRLM